MIYRNFIAPPRAFTRFSHSIIRHPRLSSDAVRLLTWQLSLPQGAREPLSRTAERARIGATAFGRAKRQLKEEGFVHERRVQAGRGRWVTQQLVSSEPLSAGEAAKILAGMPQYDGGTREEATPPQVAPSARIRAVGAPEAPVADGHPEEEPPAGKTSNLPPEPAVEEAEPDAPSEEARALIGSLPVLSPALRHIPPGMRDELARLASRWLEAGHSAADVCAHIRGGLPKDGTPVLRPGGLVRYLLREVPEYVAPLPEAVTPPPLSLDQPRVSARLAELRECEGRHSQARLFRPVGDEVFCPQCAS
ncbi:hypothetical protein [Streptomyces sp. CC208A]|uniref:hypothetical protein n=1 Tax=Streptomyces sp. CC208A TaxID=3044573 RepID=UPI0024A8CF29|nr:hypothetical protein [Streptomyces sp. CC208A]